MPWDLVPLVKGIESEGGQLIQAWAIQVTPLGTKTETERERKCKFSHFQKPNFIPYGLENERNWVHREKRNNEQMYKEK